jgi:large subunit ribosomal protein L25
MKFEITAQKRTLQGSGASRRLRRANKVPGIIYGGSEAPALIELDHNDLLLALRKEAFHASVLSLTLDGVVAIRAAARFANASLQAARPARRFPARR